MKGITYIGKANWRNNNHVFGIKDQDRFAHIYAIGKSGTGKSTLLLNMAIQDIARGHGVCIIDPHADLAETILNYIPSHRIKDVVYFSATDASYAVGFNPLHNIVSSAHSLTASNIISTLKKIWSESWGPRLEHILRFSLLSLLYYPKATLLDIQQLLTDSYFRNKVLIHVPDANILQFWRNEFDKYPPQLKAEAIAPILNKIGVLIASAPIRHIIGQTESTFSIKEIMDKRKILICNLSKGTIGEDASSLLGSFILSAIQSTALARSAQPTEARVPFYTYADEIQSYVNLSFVGLLSEVRKFSVGLFLTHQYIEQLDERITAAILGNVGTIISFRVGATDAEYIAKEFYPIFKADDFINLPRFSLYLKLMIDGATSKPFSAVSIPLLQSTFSYKADIIAYSQTKYGTPIQQVEEQLLNKYKATASLPSSLFSENA